MDSRPPASLDRQYEALGDGCGLVELRDWSSVTLTGNDRQALLHNFCTNDIKRLVAGESCEAFFTSVKGKIIGHGLVSCRDDELVVVGAPGQGQSLAAHLDRYVIREDVSVRDTTAERFYLLLAGGNQARELAANIGAPNAGAKRADRPLHWMSWNLLRSACCGLIEITGDDSPVRHALMDRGALPCGDAAFHALRIEAGTPLFGVDFDDQNLPQEVGRNEPAISFTKGCYLGQETVARIDALGHVNQQLAGVWFAGNAAPEVGSELSDAGKTAGNVTSATFSPQLQAPLALAMLRRPYNEPGIRLDSPVGRCEVVALPAPSSHAE